MAVQTPPVVGQGLCSPHARRTAPERRHRLEGSRTALRARAGPKDEVNERLDKWLRTATRLGYELKHDQVEALRCLATTNDVLYVLATGAGKSLVYLLPLLTSDTGEAAPLALYIAPLNSLIEDQHKKSTRLAKKLELPHFAVRGGRRCTDDVETDEEDGASSGDERDAEVPQRTPGAEPPAHPTPRCRAPEHAHAGRCWAVAHCHHASTASTARRGRRGRRRRRRGRRRRRAAPSAARGCGAVGLGHQDHRPGLHTDAARRSAQGATGGAAGWRGQRRRRRRGRRRRGRRRQRRRGAQQPRQRAFGAGRDDPAGGEEASLAQRGGAVDAAKEAGALA